jgi:DnaA regulatory inactivator Hda
MTQLVLPFETAHQYTFDNLVVHEGIESALAAIQSAYQTRQRPLPSLFLHGPSGTGKTHILKALLSEIAKDTAGDNVGTVYVSPLGSLLPFDNLARISSGMWESAQKICAIAVDDVHVMSQDDTAHLWNVFNKLTRSGSPVLVASREPPENLFHGNVHVKSRITAGLVLKLDLPDDGARLLIVDKMARDRNIRISEDVCRYLVTRKLRNVKELERLIDILDHTSLELQRRITIPLVKLLEHEHRL